MRAAMSWLAAQSGPPPDEIGTGDFAGWHAMLHRSGAKHPRGGSGMLTQAMQRCLEAHGGKVRLDAEVRRIVDARWQGAVASRSAKARRMSASSTDGRLERACADDNAEADRRGQSAGRSGGSVSSACASATALAWRYVAPPTALPDYLAAPSGGKPHPSHHGLQLLCPSTAYLKRGYDDFRTGVPAREPSAIAMTFSAIDPDVAPAGKHTLFVWGQYHPYELSDGSDWDSIAEREADKLLEVVYRYAPNMRGAITDRYIQTPLDLERKLGLLRGNVMHVEMSFDQMFCFRPLPELSSYRVPSIGGLYLTGASTHPGGGVFAASGYNAAHVVLADVRKRRRPLLRRAGAAGFAAGVAGASFARRFRRKG